LAKAINWQFVDTHALEYDSNAGKTLYLFRLSCMRSTNVNLNSTIAVTEF